MPNRKPLVLANSGGIKQLPHSEDLDMDLADRFARLQRRFDLLVFWMASEGFPVPEEILEDLQSC
jgi:hypothetical protein